MLIKKNNSNVKVKARYKKKGDVNSELIDIFDDEGRVKTLEDIEEEVVKRLVDIYRGNITEISKRLGIGRSTIVS